MINNIDDTPRGTYLMIGSKALNFCRRNGDAFTVLIDERSGVAGVRIKDYEADAYVELENVRVTVRGDRIRPGTLLEALDGRQLAQVERAALTGWV